MTKNHTNSPNTRGRSNDPDNSVNALKVMVSCPSCMTQFDAATTIQQMLEDHAGAQVAARQAELMRKEAELAKGQAAMEEEVRQRLDTELTKLSETARAAIREEFVAQLQAKENESAEIRKKLKDAQKKELDVMAQKRQFEAQEAELQLEFQRQLEAERKAIRESMQAQADQQRQTALAAQEAELTALRRSTEAAKTQGKELARQAAELAREKANVETLVSKRIEAERGALSAKVREDFAAQLEAKEIEAAASRTKLKAAVKKELELLKEKRQLEEATAELDLTVERRISEERQQIRQDATTKAQEQMDLALRQKELLVEDMRDKMEKMKRRLDQGSQQAQGEAQELLLEEQLRQAFPVDLFREVAKGVEGADVLQTVRDAQGRECGTILWESKRTKNWAEAWLAKLQADRVRENASIAALATQALPKGIAGIGLLDDVWVCAFSDAVPLALVLRQWMMETAVARRSLENQQDKRGMVYAYLTSSEFRSRVTTVVNAWRQMLETHFKERKAMEKLWAERERLLRMAMAGMQGLQGDLQAIAGAEIEMLPASDEGIRELEFISDATQVPSISTSVVEPPGDAGATNLPVGETATSKEERFLAALSHMGGKATNSSLQAALKMTGADYDETKLRLVFRGMVVSGQGRAGVRLRPSA